MRARIIVMFVLLTAVSLSAQTFRGTILGTATDPSGAVVAGAQVTVKNVATGLERTTETSADGSYSLPELPIGTYTVTVTQTGFQTFAANNVTVDVASERRVDAKMRPGQVSSRVEVSADELPLIETTSDTLGGTITASEMKDIPVNGRDYQKLIYLTPGIAGSPDQISDSPGSYGVFSMNGARGRSNNFLLDGTDMNDGYRNDPAINEAGVFGTPATILPIDAVAELRVLSNFEPEYGRSGGAVINMVTKSGTNQIHGTAIEYFRNDATDARNYFNPSSQPKAAFHNNQFGGSLGGPIIKDKTFFYVDYEGQRERVGVVSLGCVPDPANIAADGGPTNPVIAALLARNPWPAPNIPGVVSSDSGCITPNVSTTAPSYNNVDSLIAKIDHSFNSNNQISGRYYYGNSGQAFPLALTASGGQLPGFDTYTPTRVQLVSLSYVKTIGASKVNELRYGWNRFAEGFFPQDLGFHPSSIGLCSASSVADCQGSGAADSGLPPIIVGGFSQIGASSGVPRTRVDSNSQVIDGFSWKANKHDVKFGFEFHRTAIQQVFSRNFRGELKFEGGGLNPGSATTPASTPLQDFLAGYVDGGSEYAGDARRHTFENSYALYIQDSFHLAPTLTLNYGLRWDYFGVVGEKNNLLSNVTNYDLAAATFTLTQVGQPGLSQMYNPDHRNFSPRVSVAWDVFGHGRTVVRSGFGIFYDAMSQDMVLGHLPYPPAFDPGPAYNPIGPAQVLPSSANGGVIGAGVPTFGTPGCGECDSFVFDRNIKTPYMENYNLNIQQQFGSKLVLQVGYVGSQGDRLLRFVDLNQPNGSTIDAYDIGYAQANVNTFNGAPCYPAGGPGCISGYGVPRVYGNNPYGTFYLFQQQSSAKSNYNSLQASLRLTGWHGLTSITNYVWSRSMDTASDGEDFQPNASQPYDSTNPQREYAPSNFDVPQRFTWILGYEFPKMSGGMQRLKNGWGIDSTATLQSGQPFQLNYNFEGDFSGAGEGIDRPDVVGPITYNQHNPLDFLNLSSFAIPCTLTALAQSPTGPGLSNTEQDCVPGTRHFGNERRNELRGPTFKQWDLSIHKDTPLTERVNMQIRAEFFNVLNHPNFANPFLPAFIADAGQSGFAANGNNQEVGAGSYAIGATGDVGIGNPFLGGGGPRGVQFAAIFRF
ncbi:MAG: TonB-dependent receptor [Candidatus Sulfotelmatobacter sp.]